LPLRRLAAILVAGCNVPLGALDDAGPAGACPAPSAVIYLNGAGGVWMPGPDDSSANTSRIVSQAATLAPTSATPEAWQALVACVREKFVPYHVEVTDEDPGARPHLEIVITGDLASVLGFDPTDLGVAPFSCEHEPRAVAFIFQSAGELARDCFYTAQEAGHLFQLGHVFQAAPPDLMAATSDETAVFQDHDFSTTLCDATVQNSHRRLLEQLGPACR
jgi:hypothetical protein